MSQKKCARTILRPLAFALLPLVSLACTPADEKPPGPPHPILLVQASEHDRQWAHLLDYAFGSHELRPAGKFRWEECEGRSLVVLAKDALEAMDAPAFTEFEAALAEGMQLILEAPPIKWADLGGVLPHGHEQPQVLPWPIPGIIPRTPLRIDWELPRYRPGKSQVRGENSPLGRPMLWRRDVGLGICWTYAFHYGALAQKLEANHPIWRRAWDQVLLPGGLPRWLSENPGDGASFSFRRAVDGLQIHCPPSISGAEAQLGIPLRDSREVLTRWEADWPEPRSILHEENGLRWRSIRVPPGGGQLKAVYAPLSP